MRSQGGCFIFFGIYVENVRFEFSPMSPSQLLFFFPHITKTALGNEAMDAKRTWTTVTVDGVDQPVEE